MPDFRMNKQKPIGSRTLSTIAGYTAATRPQPAPAALEEPEPKQAFELTPDLTEAAEVEVVPVAEALGGMITQTEIVNEEKPGDTDGGSGPSDEECGCDCGTSACESANSVPAAEASADSDDMADTSEEESAEPDVPADTSVAEEAHGGDSSESSGGNVVGDIDGESGKSDGEDTPTTADSEVEAEQQTVFVVTPPADFAHDHKDEDDAIESSEESK